MGKTFTKLDIATDNHHHPSIPSLPIKFNISDKFKADRLPYLGGLPIFPFSSDILYHPMYDESLDTESDIDFEVETCRALNDIKGDDDQDWGTHDPEEDYNWDAEDPHFWEDREMMVEYCMGLDRKRHERMMDEMEMQADREEEMNRF